MAITKLSHVKERSSGNPNAGLYACIDYILNPDKTEDRWIGGNAGLTTQNVYDRMMTTKREFHKADGRQCYHFVISFSPGETDALTCFNVAQDFCEKYLKGQYEYVFSVHTDHKHIHAHIVFNSVSMVDGHKYHYSDGQWESKIQPITDSICQKYRLPKLEYDRSKRKGVDYGAWREKKDPTGSQRLRETIDAAIAKSHSYDEFLSIMEKNYQIKKGFSKKWNSEYLSFRSYDNQAGRFRRNYVLGSVYSVTSIKQRIILNQTEIPINLKRATPNIRDFEFSIGSGIRTERSGVHLTQRQKRYMINYWKLKSSERKVTGGGSSSWQLSSEIDRSLRDLQTLQDNKIKTADDLSKRLHEMDQLKSSTRKQLQALRSHQENSETKKILDEYITIQKALSSGNFAAASEGKLENRLDEIEETYPIQDLLRRQSQTDQQEAQLSQTLKNMQSSSRRLAKLKRLQK